MNAIIGPLLATVTAIEALSSWSGDEAWATAFGTLRIAVTVGLLIVLCEKLPFIAR